jgi:hypothetical protein
VRVLTPASAPASSGVSIPVGAEHSAHQAGDATGAFGLRTTHTSCVSVQVSTLLFMRCAVPGKIRLGF